MYFYCFILCDLCFFSVIDMYIDWEILKLIIMYCIDIVFYKFILFIKCFYVVLLLMIIYFK